VITRDVYKNVYENDCIIDYSNFDSCDVSHLERKNKFITKLISGFLYFVVAVECSEINIVQEI